MAENIINVDVKTKDSENKKALCKKNQDLKSGAITDELINKISVDLNDNNYQKVEELFATLHYADQAIVFESIKHELLDNLIYATQSTISPLLLVELNHQSKCKILKVIGSQKIAKLVNELPPEDAVEFLRSLSRHQQIGILKTVKTEQRREIRAVMNHPENSVGLIMDINYILLEGTNLVDEARAKIKQMLPKEKHNRIYDIFVCDKNSEVVGIISMLGLVKSDSKSKLEEIMSKDFVSINVNDTQREMVYTFKKYNLSTVPVLDDKSEVVGQVSIDTVRYIADEQNEEDVLKMSGVLTEPDKTIAQTTKVRFVWLFINLFTTAISSWIISFFEFEIQQITALAVLMPITVSMGSNAGMQTVTVIIRAIATKHLNKNNFRYYFGKEMIVASLNALIFGFISIVSVYQIYHNFLLAAVFAVAIALTLLVSVLSGIFAPIIMKKIGTDPAITSVVLLTAIIDVVAFLSFLGLARMLLI